MLDRYRALLLDLDGVLFRGDEPVPGAADVLAEIRARGLRPVFVTNNSSRTPAQVADKLVALGFPAVPREVVTSALALEELVAGRPARTAFVVGEDGVRDALRGLDIEVLEGDPEAADLVVVGWDRAADYPRLKRASLLVQGGARLLATNADASYPAPDGNWPGAGALLGVIEVSAGVRAEVAGKPRAAFFERAARAAGEGPYLVVGDRLETDVAGAEAMGWDSALVLTGVATGADLLGSAWQPTYVVRALPDLLADPPGVEPASPEDVAAARALLAEADLWAEDLDDRVKDLVVARAGDEVVGTGALELAGPDALLRSVAVAAPRRGSAVGLALTAALVSRARREGASAVWLLTETAEAYFAKLGFVRVGRADVPADIGSRPAVADACGDTAAAMRLDVGAAG